MWLLQTFPSQAKTARHVTARKKKFSIKESFSGCDQISSFLRIWSHLLKKSLLENFISCAALEANSSYKTEMIFTSLKKEISTYLDNFSHEGRRLQVFCKIAVLKVFTKFARRAPAVHSITGVYL